MRRRQMYAAGIGQVSPGMVTGLGQPQTLPPALAMRQPPQLRATPSVLPKRKRGRPPKVPRF